MTDNKSQAVQQIEKSRYDLCDAVKAALNKFTSETGVIVSAINYDVARPDPINENTKYICYHLFRISLRL